MNIVLKILFLITLTSCLAQKVEKEASSGNINTGAPFSWDSANFPRNLRISTAFSSDEVTNIVEMTTAWETAVEDKKNFFNHDQNSDTVTDRTSEISSPNIRLDDLGDDGVNGIYKITHWPASLPGSALAVTQIFGSRHFIGSANEYVRIEHADILINEHYYNFRTGNSHVNGTFDFKTVILHELGHYLGLGHSTGDTVMVTSIGELTSNRSPTSFDMRTLAGKYSITLSNFLFGNKMAAYNQKALPPIDRGPGIKVKIQIELMANGECIHKEDGAIVGRHPSNLKNL